MQLKDDFKAIINKIEQKQNLILPSIFFDSEELKTFSKSLNERNLYGLFVIYQNLPKNKDLINVFNQINSKLKVPRVISKENLKLIENITHNLNAGKFPYVLDIFGPVLQIINTIEYLKNNDVDSNISITIYFWAYLTTYELIINFLSSLLFKLSISQKNNDYINEYNKKLDAGEHLTAGYLKDICVKYKFINYNDSNFLSKSDIIKIRNSIAHGNIYFDNIKNLIIIKGWGKQLTLEELNSYFIEIYEFLLELIYQLNNKEEDIGNSILKHNNWIFNQIRGILRSSSKKEKFYQLDFSK